MTSGTSPRTHLETGSSAPVPGVPEPDRTYPFRCPVPGVPEPGRTCLVAGSYPPVPGLAAAATVAAVRRVWAGGGEVVVVSPRPSAAPFVMPVVGAPVGRELVKFSRRGSGRRWGGNARVAAACDEVVVCMEPGWPVPSRPGNNRQHRAVRSLVAALSRFEGAELVVTGDLGVAHDVLAGLWPAVQRVTASSEDAASALRVAGAPNVRVVVPATSPGLTIQAGVAGVAGVARAGSLASTARWALWNRLSCCWWREPGACSAERLANCSARGHRRSVRTFGAQERPFGRRRCGCECGERWQTALNSAQRPTRHGGSGGLCYTAALVGRTCCRITR